MQSGTVPGMLQHPQRHPSDIVLVVMQAPVVGGGGGGGGGVSETMSETKFISDGIDSRC